MKRRSIGIFLLFFSGFVSYLFAQNNVPVADGTVGQSEYASVYHDGKMSIYSTVTQETIYMAVTAPTNGWVAVGLGSLRMNGATIFMGYVDNDGNPHVTLQKGRFHSHSQTDEITPIAEVIRQSGDTTTLEIAVKRAQFVRSGQTELDYIYAYGTSQDFRTRHVFRNASTLAIQ